MGNYYFKILDYKKSSKTYNNVVSLLNTIGTDFSFTYIPFGNYDSFIMFDFTTSERMKKVEKLNKLIISFADRELKTSKASKEKINQSKRYVEAKQLEKQVLKELERHREKIVAEISSINETTKIYTNRPLNIVESISLEKIIKAKQTSVQKMKESIKIKLEKLEIIDTINSSVKSLRNTSILKLLDGGRKKTAKLEIEKILDAIRSNENKMSIEKIISTVTKALFGYVMDKDILGDKINNIISGIIAEKFTEGYRTPNLEALIQEELTQLVGLFDRLEEEKKSIILNNDYISLRGDDLKEATLNRYVPIAKGIVYDYNDFGWSDDPEKYFGGYAVPEDYDSEDPFNLYYPWGEKLDIQDSSWKSFGTNTWEIDSVNDTFTCTDTTQEIGGYILDTLDKKEYRVKLRFKVTGDSTDGVGVYLRYLDELNHYRFTITGGSTYTLGMNNYMELLQVINGSKTVVTAPLQPFYWDKNGWYTIECVSLEDRLMIYVNNVLQYDVSV